MSVIVTGTSRGVGLGIITQLLELSDCGVVAVLRKSNEAVDSLKAKFADRLQLVLGDVGDFATNKSAVDTAIASFGSLRGVIINAALMVPICNMDDVQDHLAETQTLYNTNLLGPISLISYAVPHLQKAGPGRIVAVTTNATQGQVKPGWGVYGGTKVALNYIMKTVARENPDSILTLAVHPGVIDTEMTANLIKDGKKAGVDVSHYEELVAHGGLKSIHDAGRDLGGLVLGAPLAWSGEYVSADDPKAKEFSLK